MPETLDEGFRSSMDAREDVQAAQRSGCFAPARDFHFGMTAILG